MRSVMVSPGRSLRTRRGLAVSLDRAGLVVVILSVSCAVWHARPVFGEPIGSSGSRTPMELTTRGMLLQRWDRNRDGRIDMAEAEVARTQMRRERIEQAERSRVDPVTGRRRDELFSEDESSGQLADSDASSGLLPATSTPVPAPQEEQPEAIPGSDEPRGAVVGSPMTTLLGPPSGLPSASVRAPLAGTVNAPFGNSSAARLLPPGTSAGQASMPMGGSWPYQRPTSPYGSAMTGGVRAGAPAVRPGFGAGAGNVDLNAGRLLGGLPPTRGTNSPFRGFSPPGLAPPAAGGLNTGRLPTTGSGGLPSPPSTPTEFYGP
jgi:hypothetical protein